MESLDEEAFKNILNQIPQDIIKRNPDEFSGYDKVRVTDFSRNKRT
jgi:hypothetical protein